MLLTFQKFCKNDHKSAHRRPFMCRRGACASPAFCSVIAHSWLDLALCDTQGPVVSKERNESTRSKSQISPEWTERHKFSPTDCCPRHVLPIEHMNNEHSQIADCPVRAKACFSGMLLGIKASQFVRRQRNYMKILFVGYGLMTTNSQKHKQLC